MDELIRELIINLTRARMALQLHEFESMLNADKKIDKKESGTLIAGYKKALDDMDKVFMSIAEM